MVAHSRVRRQIPRLVGGVAAILLILAFVWFVRTMMNGKSSKPPRQVQTVQVIRPPPPPPDEPPPPPPEKTDEPLPQDEPEPSPEPEQAPMDQPLGIDAEGAAGGDAFGLAARKGGSDLVGGTGSAPFAWYTGKIVEAINDRLSSFECFKSAKGSVSLNVTLEADGRFKQVQLATTTGNRKVDQCVEKSLTMMPQMSDPAPPGLPALVKIKVVPRI